MVRQSMTLALLSLLAAPPLWARDVTTDYTPHGLYAAVAGGPELLSSDTTSGSFGNSARMELGFEPLRANETMADFLRLGVVLQGSRHDAMHYQVQADLPSTSGPPGDFRVFRPGVVATVRPVRSWFQLGVRAELGALYWACPFDEATYQEEIMPELGRDPGTAGLGAWANAGLDLGVAMLRPGPVLQLSLDSGYFLASSLVTPAAAARLGVVTSF